MLSLKGGQEKFFIIFISELHGNYCERPSVNSRELVRAEKSLCNLPASEKTYYYKDGELGGQLGGWM